MLFSVLSFLRCCQILTTTIRELLHLLRSSHFADIALLLLLNTAPIILVHTRHIHIRNWAQVEKYRNYPFSIKTKNCSY